MRTVADPTSVFNSATPFRFCEFQLYFSIQGVCEVGTKLRQRAKQLGSLLDPEMVLISTDGVVLLRTGGLSYKPKFISKAPNKTTLWYTSSSTYSDPPLVRVTTKKWLSTPSPPCLLNSTRSSFLFKSQKRDLKKDK